MPLSCPVCVMELTRTCAKVLCDCHLGLFLVAAPVRGRAFLYILLHWLHCLVFLFLIASCWGGVGWVGWVGAITSLHLPTYLLLGHKNFSIALAHPLHATLHTFPVDRSYAWGGLVGWGWFGAIMSLHLHTYLMLRHILFFLQHLKNFSSTSTPSTRYVIYFLLLCSKKFSSSFTSSAGYFISITWCYVTRTSLELMVRHDNFSCTCDTTQSYFMYI
jgi:hypothetical protein